jgi:SPP1 gp7 family putative phage head morphogenesis protein
MSHRTAAVRDGEAKLTRSLAKHLKAIGKEIARKVSRVAKAEGDDEIDEAIDGAEWGAVAASVKVELVAVAEDGAKRALALLGVDDEGILEHTYGAARDWATNRAAELVGKKWDGDELVDNPRAEFAITDSLRDELRSAVADAIDQGLSAATLSDNIEDLSGFSEQRAALIARTELVNANNQAHLSAFKNSGVVDQKEWSTSNEESVCEDCQANEDEGPIDLDDEFPSGDDAPVAHPACMCVLIARISEDVEDEEAEVDEDEESDEAAE